MQGEPLCFQTISRVERSRVAIENASNRFRASLNTRYPLHVVNWVEWRSKIRRLHRLQPRYDMKVV